jgi:hypothetical protein
MSWVITPQEKTPLDQDYRNVSLLLHGNGTNGSTTITDSSLTPKTVTAINNAQISTAQSKFGEASIAFDGTGDEISIPASADFQFGTGDFTIEGWCYLLSAPTTGFPDLFKDLNANGFINFRQSTFFAATTSSAIIATSPSGPSINQWFHYAVTRSGNTFRVFLNGVSGTPGTFTGTWGATGTVTLGGGNTQQLHGYIDDLRITKGVARYTANFTPPTAPFPDAGPAQ